LHRRGLPFECLHFHKYGHEMFIPSWARKGSFFFTDRQSLVDLTLTVIIRPLSNFIPSWFIKGLTPSCILFPFTSLNRMIYWGGNPPTPPILFFFFFFQLLAYLFSFSSLHGPGRDYLFFSIHESGRDKTSRFSAFFNFPSFFHPFLDQEWIICDSFFVPLSFFNPFMAQEGKSLYGSGRDHLWFIFHPFMIQEGIVCDSLFIPLWPRKGSSVIRLSSLHGPGRDGALFALP